MYFLHLQEKRRLWKESKGNDLRELDRVMSDRFEEDPHAQWCSLYVAISTGEWPYARSCWMLADLPGKPQPSVQQKSLIRKVYVTPETYAGPAKSIPIGRQFSGSHRFGPTVCFRLSFFLLFRMSSLWPLVVMDHFSTLAICACRWVLLGPLSLWDDVRQHPRLPCSLIRGSTTQRNWCIHPSRWCQINPDPHQ